MTEATEKSAHPLVVFNQQLRSREGEFKAALPPHMPVERFVRVVMTATQLNPELLEAERRSLFNACMRSAQDGLLPDGREAAILVRRDPQRGKVANYQPMIAGIRKKARNSGEIATWDAHIVREGDHFQFQLGDNPQINHAYDLKTEQGSIIGAYSVCVLKDGSRSYEVMSIGEIHAVRDRSDGWKAFKAGKIKSTPWSTDEGEMCRKTVAKRHSKVLPLSSDLDDLIRRDDELYDPVSREPAAQEPRRPRLVDKMDRLSGRLPAPDPEDEPVDDQRAQDTAGEDDQTIEPLEPLGEEIADTIAAATEPERSPERLALFNELRELSMEGGLRKLNLRLGSLSPEQRDLLTPEDIEALRAVTGASVKHAR